MTFLTANSTQATPTPAPEIIENLHSDACSQSENLIPRNRIVCFSHLNQVFLTLSAKSPTLGAITMKEPQQISFWHKSPTGYTENTSHHLIHSIYLCYIVNICKKSMFSNSLKLNAFHFCQIVYVTFWRYIHCCLVHFIENKQILNLLIFNEMHKTTVYVSSLRSSKDLSCLYFLSLPPLEGRIVCSIYNQTCTAKPKRGFLARCGTAKPKRGFFSADTNVYKHKTIVSPDIRTKRLMTRHIRNPNKSAARVTTERTGRSLARVHACYAISS